ncbi:MAG: exodeoxyribonuclease VII large subunit [Dermabacter sp.]|nr:exodeoxyribonuclease VII large subunit [Dermabacter sp.]
MTEHDAPLAATAAETTADNPWPVRLLSVKMREYVDRMSTVWVKGELVQVNRRPGSGMAFMSLRDIDAEASFQVAVREQVLSRATVEPAPGAQVVMQCKATFWGKRGSLQLEAYDIRPVGLGELLARLEQLRRTLHAEGLFDPSRKKPLPFLPTTVGLICGRQSAAERDVVVNAEKRWPAVTFQIREVAVQGAKAVGEVSAALRELDADPLVDVIIISRGGGSMEDLLPFSDESLVRLAAAATTPIVSAIGHEVDTPLLDLVADVRASTPTDAAKMVVPDIAAEHDQLDVARSRIRSALRTRLEREESGLASLRSRPAFAEPHTMLIRHRQEVHAALAMSRTLIHARLDRGRDDIRHLTSQARALSPLSTLKRGYAVVQTSEGTIITAPDNAPAGTALSIRLAGGRLDATSDGTSLADQGAGPATSDTDPASSGDTDAPHP